ncbi:TPA: hypothetical protein DEP96_00870 [Candidatus Uhrbacteria bacterium]|nr:hypothetical protein [Candidatus Uhrbacteria bacterium]
MRDQNISFSVAYGGPAVVNHEMDVKDLAPALLAIGELMEEVNSAVNPQYVKLAINIRATKEGSVVIDLTAAQSLVESAKNLFASTDVTAILNAKEILALVFGTTGVSSGLVAFIKWLRGRKISNVTKLEAGKYQITLVDGEASIINELEVKIFSIISIRKKVEQFIRRPLSSTGITEITVTTPDNEQTISQNEAEYFSAPLIEEQQLQESTSIMSLQLVTISLQGDYKWRFNDGIAAFTADMLDQDFRKKVEQNEIAFAKDDLFVAEVKTRQYILNGELKSERSIIKVKEFQSAASAKMRLPGI